MKKLSLIEFQRLCSQFGPSLYIFNSENQPDCKINIKVEQKYTDIIVKLDPGRICLKSESGYFTTIWTSTGGSSTSSAAASTTTTWTRRTPFWSIKFNKLNL